MIARPTKAALRVIALLAVIAGALLSVASVGAHHIGGATYNGTLTGAGSFSFTVSDLTADGTEVTSVSAPGPIPGEPNCTVSLPDNEIYYGAEIVNHSFNLSSRSIDFSGSFDKPQSASGTFRVNADGCDTGTRFWNATTTAAPQECKGQAATVVLRPRLAREAIGTNGKDVIIGTAEKDTINAKGGNDTVCAKGGNDNINGGGGKDKLYGQGGKDNLVGGAGKDTCVGAAGKDAANCETEKGI
jgi:Ca2+-binding RTX toxin-like protein